MRKLLALLMSLLIASPGFAADQKPQVNYSGQLQPIKAGDTVGVSNGGTGATTLTQHGVIVGNGATAVNVVTPGTLGYALVSNGPSSDPTWQLPPAGANPLTIGPAQIGAAAGAPPIATYCPNGAGEASICMRTDTGWLYSMWDPTTAIPTRVQEVAANNSGSVTLSATPTVGNYLIATSYSTSAVPTAGAGWTSFATRTGTNNVNVLYHLVGPSDTTSQTPVTGSGLIGTMVIEVSGLDATNFANNVQGAVQFGTCTGVGGSCTITLSATTVGSNVLGIASANSNGAASSTPTYNAGWTHTTSGGPNTITSQAFPSASSSVSAQATAGTTGAGSNNTATLILLQPSTNAQTTGWQQVGYFTTFYNGGVSLSTNARSLNCSTNTTCTTDAQGNITLTASGSGTVTVTGGAPTTGDCAKFSGATSITDAGAACGSGGGGGNTYTFNNGAMQLISTVVTSGSQSSVSFSSIPGTYRDLQVVVTGRNTGSGAVALDLQLNGDTAADYALGYLGGGTTPYGGNLYSQTSFGIGNFLPGTGAPANGNSTATFMIRNYAATTWGKPISFFGGSEIATSGQFVDEYDTAIWNSTSAVTSIKVFPASNAFADGTVVTLYGISDSSTPASAPIVPPQGRLTLVSHTPVMTSDQTAQSTIYYDCYAGNTVPYYDGSKDNVEGIASCEVSLTMATSGTGVTNSSGVFDVWWVHSGGSRICVATNGSGGGWASDTGGSNTARGTGYSQVHNTRGYWTNVNSITHCYNGTTDYGSVSADQATYLGTLYTTAAGQTGMQFAPTPAAGGSNSVQGLYNAYNRVSQTVKSGDSTACCWTYNSTTWRASDNSNSNRVTWVDGLAQSPVEVEFHVLVGNGGTAGDAGIDEDATSGAPSSSLCSSAQVNLPANDYATPQARCSFPPLIGLHFAQAMEATTGLMSFGGGQSSAPAVQWHMIRATLGN